MFLELISFCLDTKVHIIHGHSLVFEKDGTAVPSRQDLLVEMDCIPVIVAILKSPFLEWGGHISLDDCRHVKGKMI